MTRQIKLELTIDEREAVNVLELIGNIQEHLIEEMKCGIFPEQSFFITDITDRSLTEAAIAELLNSSFTDISYQYDELTMNERKAVGFSEALFHKVVNWMRVRL